MPDQLDPVEVHHFPLEAPGRERQIGQGPQRKVIGRHGERELDAAIGTPGEEQRHDPHRVPVVVGGDQRQPVPRREQFLARLRLLVGAHGATDPLSRSPRHPELLGGGVQQCGQRTGGDTEREAGGDPDQQSAGDRHRHRDRGRPGGRCPEQHLP